MFFLLGYISMLYPKSVLVSLGTMPRGKIGTRVVTRVAPIDASIGVAEQQKEEAENKDQGK